MTFGKNSIRSHHAAPDFYQQDDIIRGLRASLVAVLATTLASTENNFDFLRGVFSLARSQAALYGIHWSDMMLSLREVPEVWCLIQELQVGALNCIEQKEDSSDAG